MTDELVLVLPTTADEAKIMDYKAEFTAAGDSMDSTAGLGCYSSFAPWFAAVQDNSTPDTVRENRVPASTYMALRKSDGRLVGMIDIRHVLNEYLALCGGHIGYSVRKSERRKGYATEMLRMALALCPTLGIHKALVTCNKENLASARTILANGGVLENEVLDEADGTLTQRYWVQTGMQP